MVQRNTKLTQEEFIARANQVWGDRFDLSETVYSGSRHKIKVICKKHGPFEQTAEKFLRGACGCKRCYEEKHGVQNRRALSQNEFLERAHKVWGDRYDLSQAKYVNARSMIDVICREHGVFTIEAHGFLRGNGCFRCGVESANNKNSSTSEQFVLKAIQVHGFKYDYSKVNYKNSREKVCIICPKHGEFYQKPNSHLTGEGCPRCAQTWPLGKERFIEKAVAVHGNIYDYSLVEYAKNSDKVIIICPKHGRFSQEAKSHLDGKGCPKCSLSQGERKVMMFLDNHNIKYEQQKTFPGLKRINPLKFDFYLPEINTCIEYQGVQHYRVTNAKYDNISRLLDRQEKDNIKRDFCRNNGIDLIEIKYTENIDKTLNKHLQSWTQTS